MTRKLTNSTYPKLLFGLVPRTRAYVLTIHLNLVNFIFFSGCN